MSKSEAVTKLWRDEAFRQTQSEARQASRDRQRATWPRINCAQCNVEFAIHPCRVGVKKCCSRKCITAYKTGRPNLKNRGRVPSRRAGSGISGTYKGQLFRSLYELSFIINVLEANGINATYEELRIPLEDGKCYVPDFVSHQTKTIYEVKYAKALTQPQIISKLAAGRQFAEVMGYTFEVYTEQRMRTFSLEEIVQMVKAGDVMLHPKKNGGVIYRRVMKLMDDRVHGEHIQNLHGHCHGPPYPEQKSAVL